MIQTCTLHSKLDVLWEVVQPMLPTIINAYRCPCCLRARHSANCGRFYGATVPVCKSACPLATTVARGVVLLPHPLPSL